MRKYSFDYFFTNAITSIPYTLIIGPICQLILYGIGGVGFGLYTIPKYILGWAITSFFPTALLAAAMHDRLFKKQLAANIDEWRINLCFAVIFEFVYGVLVALLFAFLMPGGSRSFGAAMYEFVVTYPACIVADLLIATFILPLMQKLAAKILSLMGRGGEQKGEA